MGVEGGPRGVLDFLELRTTGAGEAASGAAAGADGEAVQRSLVERAKHSAFMLFYLISKDQQTGVVLTYVQQLIVTSQLSYCAVASAHYQWNHLIKAWTVPVLNVLSLGDLTQGKQAIVGVLLAASTVLLVLMMSAHFCISLVMSESVDFLWLLHLLEFLLRLLSTVLFVPVVNMLMETFQGRNADLAELLVPGSQEAAWSMFGAAFLVAAFVSLNAVAALVLVDNNPFSRNSVRAVHGRVEAASLVMRGVVAVAFSLSGLFDPWIVVATQVTMSSLLLAAHVFYMPFYSMEMNRLAAVSNGLFWWVTVCLVVAQVIGDEHDYGSLVGLVVGSLPVLVTLARIVDSRAEQLRSTEPTPHMSPYVVELALRFRHFGLEPYAADKEKAALEKEWPRIEQAYRRVVESMFKNNVFLTLHLSALVRFVGKNELMAAQLVQRARGSAHAAALDHEFMFFKHLQRHREQSNGAESGALSYVAFTHHRNQSEAKITEAVTAIHKLWELVAKKDLAGDRGNADSGLLLEVASQVYLFSTQARQHIEELVTRSHGSRQALMLYAVYAEDVMGDEMIAQRVRRAAEAMAQAQDAHGGQGGGNSHSAFGGLTCGLTISGEEKTFGQLLNATEEFQQMFGLQRHEVVGQPVFAAIFPPGVDTMFADFLRAYLVTSKDFNATKRRVWVRNALAGYASEAEAVVSVAQSDTGSINFFCRFIPLAEQSCFCVVDGDGRILFFSQIMMREFGVRLIPGASAAVYTFVPDLASVLPRESLARLAAPAQFVMKQSEDDEAFTVFARPLGELPSADAAGGPKSSATEALDAADESDRASFSSGALDETEEDEREREEEQSKRGNARAAATAGHRRDDEDDEDRDDEELGAGGDGRARSSSAHSLAVQGTPSPARDARAAVHPDARDARDVPRKLKQLVVISFKQKLPARKNGDMALSEKLQDAEATARAAVLKGRTTGGQLSPRSGAASPPRQAQPQSPSQAAGRRGKSSDGDDNKSYHSESTGMSASSSARSSRKRTVVQAKIEMERQRLLRFRMVCVRMWLMFIAFSIGAFVWQSTQFSNYTACLDLMALATRRAADIIKLAIGVHELRRHLGDTPEDVVAKETMVQFVNSSASDLRVVHEAFKTTLHTLGSQLDQETLMFDPNGLQQTMDGVQYTNLSFDQGVLKLITSASGLIADHDNLKTCGTQCVYILNNAYFEVMDMAIASRALVTVQSNDVLVVKWLGNSVVAYFSVLILLGLVAWKVMPVINEAEVTKGALLEALSNVPAATLKRLREEAKTKRDNIRRKMEAARGVKTEEEEDQAAGGGGGGNDEAAPGVYKMREEGEPLTEARSPSDKSGAAKGQDSELRLPQLASPGGNNSNTAKVGDRRGASGSSDDCTGPGRLNSRLVVDDRRGASGNSDDSTGPGRLNSRKVAPMPQQPDGGAGEPAASSTTATAAAGGKKAAHQALHVRRKDEGTEGDGGAVKARKVDALCLAWRRWWRCLVLTVKVCAPLIVIPVFFFYHDLKNVTSVPYMTARALSMTGTDRLRTATRRMHLFLEGQGKNQPWHRWAQNSTKYSRLTQLTNIVNLTDHLHYNLVYQVDDRLAWKERMPIQYSLLFENGCVDEEHCIQRPDEGLVSEDPLIADLHRGLAFALQNYVTAGWAAVAMGHEFTPEMAHAFTSFISSEALATSLDYNANLERTNLIATIADDDTAFKTSFVVFGAGLALAIYLVFRGFKALSYQLRDAHQIIILIPNSALEDSVQLRTLVLGS